MKYKKKLENELFKVFPEPDAPDYACARMVRGAHWGMAFFFFFFFYKSSTLPLKTPKRNDPHQYSVLNSPFSGVSNLMQLINSHTHHRCFSWSLHWACSP